MASTTTANSALISLLQRSNPSAVPTPNEGGEYAISELIKSTFPAVDYSDSEKAEVNQWLITSNHVASPDEDTAKTTERLSSLNTHLSTRTTLLGSKPSLADLSLYARLGPVIANWSPDQRTGEQGYHHIVRHLNFVQNAPLFALAIPDADKVAIDEDDVRSPIKPIDPKAEKERKKREKENLAAAAAADAATTPVDPSAPTDGAAPGGRKAKKEAKKEAKSTGDVIAAAVGAEVPVAQPNAGVKREKKAKAPKAAPEPAKPAALSPSLIDLRVGHILKAEYHPNADSLFVSTIACGDAPGTDNTSEFEGQVVRTVCSGLNGLVPLAAMQGRKVVAVCNLKPVTMRGVKSAAMVLAASPRVAEGEVEDGHKGPVELVELPEGAVAGERVWFEGWEGEPEGVLNPKKKIWEMCQVGFTTTGGREVAFDAGKVKELEGKEGLGLLRTRAGLCTVESLTDATVR